ncbi:ubiquitin recognition factor in ER-associated degradation protein 1 isoform X2 [Motacilla alba alba]|uniref:ubiquitin recognition factor in ER-associated degradation protein 1 isoform X2 n=1 Tax=Motacilla alba alba TaxID=1094192 RepID=UPI0018D55388|nr:ubiquitin recognition factor in ER-associated degradation protein 1 isoform X2 [Motacilla alba alba]
MAASEGARSRLPPSPAMAARAGGAARHAGRGGAVGGAQPVRRSSGAGPARPGPAAPRERPPPPCSLLICLTTPSPGCSRTVFQPSTAASRYPCLPDLMTAFGRGSGSIENTLTVLSGLARALRKEEGSCSLALLVIMPPSALDQLSRLNITYPMLFKLTNKNSDRMTHCGVLEFVADEGICYLPHWMMQNLLLEEGGLVQVESVNLQVATYSKFQPQSPDFLDITNPKAVLENALRNFACLTTGDVIAINYNEKIYELRVMETKPDKAVSIIECDMNVDFDAPLGYKEPERSAQHEETADVETDHSGYVSDIGFRAFSGSGNRLDGKKKGVEPSPSPIKPGDIRRGIPNYDFKIGRITFIRNSRPLVKKVEEDESGSRFIAFSGEGQSLRKKGRKP